MARQPDVLVLHTVSTLFSDGTARELETELEARLPETAIERSSTPPQSAELIEGTPIVLTALPTPDLTESAEALEWMQALNAGVDMYDRQRIEKRDIVLTNASGVAAEPIAEQVMGYLLAFERTFLRGFDNKRRGVWERYSGGELRGKTVGIIGIGAIGTRVAELASAFGMEVIGTKRDTDSVSEVVDAVRKPDDLFRVLSEADYVVLSCPLTDETEGLIGTAELATMRSDGVLVNIARGGVVEEGALTEALQQRGIKGAALDVFEREPLPSESPLWDLSNVIVTPHMAGSTPAYMGRVADLFAENYRHFVADERAAMANRIV